MEKRTARRQRCGCARRGDGGLFLAPCPSLPCPAATALLPCCCWCPAAVICDMFGCWAGVALLRMGRSPAGRLPVTQRHWQQLVPTFASRSHLARRPRHGVGPAALRAGAAGARPPPFAGLRGAQGQHRPGGRVEAVAAAAAACGAASLSYRSDPMLCSAMWSSGITTLSCIASFWTTVAGSGRG